MANKAALLSKQRIKVQNMSGFDKGNFNALTAPLGALVPIKKQLMLPGNARCSLKISAQLPPLAADAFLRTHLKVEAFLVPLRILSGSFEPWFSGIQVDTVDSQGSHILGSAQLPRLVMSIGPTASDPVSQSRVNSVYGPHSLLDYLGVKKRLSGGNVDLSYINSSSNASSTKPYNAFFPLAYQRIWDDWYRNKLIEQPAFVRPTAQSSGSLTSPRFCPYLAYSSITNFTYLLNNSGNLVYSSDLNNGHLLTLRQRNYGDDYFTTALPQAQSGNPITVDTSGGNFTISSLRLANSMQRFSEINQISGPDFIQSLDARYGVSPSAQVAQRPILLGSADFPMFTSGVEQTAQASSSANPFTSVGTRFGRAHAEGQDFVCDFKVSEPSIFMVIASLVPEANYASGLAHDMTIFTQAGSLVDLPVASLEGTGYELIPAEEVDGSETNVLGFGYQPRYMWHKAGSSINEVHGLFRSGASLDMFIPQRSFASGVQLNSAFLKVAPTDLDNVTAVSGAISQYGVMIDSYISLNVSEPLAESRMPSLVDPAEEHGDSVYVNKRGIEING